ncbi:MAG: NAD-binding oxidoreductase, partial [Lachnospiraceae bacterium]|nr:NAD-binding oxidoreductase [Lachnospiraceae bacterium]
MYPILEERVLADKIDWMVVEAPRVAKNCQPGEFVMVKIDEEGE